MPPQLDPQFIWQRADVRMKEHRERAMVEALVVERVWWRVKRSDEDGQDEPRSTGYGGPYEQKATTVADA
jgi:hypothetical protein